MLAYGAGFDASWRPPRLHVDRNLTVGDVDWLNRQMELVDKPAVKFARDLPLPPLPSGRIPRRGTQVLATQMASDYEPPSMSLLLPSERMG